VDHGKRTRVFPLSQADDAPATTVVDALDVVIESAIRRRPVLRLREPDSAGRAVADHQDGLTGRSCTRPTSKRGVMKALRLMDWKSEPEIVDLPKPTPGPGQ